MTTNKTSQAVEELLKSPFHPVVPQDFKKAILAVAEKYQRMEEALRKILFYDSFVDKVEEGKLQYTHDEKDFYASVANDALSFDPLA